MGKGKPINGRHPNFKRGEVITQHGYVLIFVGVEHHLSDCRGYVYEHRLVAEKKIGRRLMDGEQIHHIDGNKNNNNPNNLEVAKSARHHNYMHRKMGSNRRKPDEKNVLTKCACGCGKEFLKYDSGDRPRKYISGHNPIASPTMDIIIKMITERGSVPVKDIIKESGKNKAPIATCLYKMHKAGIIKKIKHGVYGR